VDKEDSCNRRVQRKGKLGFKFKKVKLNPGKKKKDGISQVKKHPYG